MRSTIKIWNSSNLTRKLGLKACRMLGFMLLALTIAALCINNTYANDVSPADITIENLAIAESVSGKEGDPVAGRKVFADRSLGNCLACHVNKELSEQLFHGNVGPSLDGIANRWSREQLRTIVVNAKAVFTENTIMPAFYSLNVGKNVREDLKGKTILTAQQVEDVVAYLSTLK